MSVLIDIHSILVRRRSLDDGWPGGTNAYLAAAEAAFFPVRHLCADDNLTSVSFDSIDDCRTWIVRLESNGIRDAAGLDLSSEPSLYDWIDWRTHPDGYACAWLAGTNPGKLAAPKGWKPPRAATGRRDNRMMQLAREDGREYLLNLDTGEQVVRPLPRAEAPTQSATTRTAPPSATRDSSLMSVVRAVVDCLEWEVEDDGKGALSARLDGEVLCFLGRIIVHESARVVRCFGFMPAYTPVERRSAMAEAIVRINQRLRLGAFDLDFDDGEVRYRIACGVQGGLLSERMVLMMLKSVVGSIDRYGPALMQVLLGAVAADDAVRRAIDGGSA
jgi:hypothetical protein